MNNLNVTGHIGDQSRRWSNQDFAGNRDPRRARQACVGGREQADAMAQLGESVNERRHDTLRPAIPPHRQRMVGQQRDVQG
ncbi:MAG TPA: hypothetical protein VF864_06435 [Gemmatimonadales bacterium]